MAGVDGLRDHPLYTESAVPLTTTSGVHAGTIAEYAITALLALAHRVPAMIEWQRRGVWPPDAQRWPLFVPTEIRGATLGIIGYGSIGRYLADVAEVLGMEVLVADPFATVSDGRIQHVPLDDLLGRADYVVCLAIANEQTENLIGQAALARMQRHAFFINLSRGNLVDEAALAATLRENRIAGAAMDVGRALDQMPTPELAKLPNVVATPHIGGLTPPAIESQALETVRQVEKIAAGEVPVGAVNASTWTRRP
jgi:D-3-phosphoglycerate dehydrogenase